MTWTPAPPCLHGIELTFNYGGMQHGKRMISATHLDPPGRIGAGLRFARLWVSAHERDPFSGECSYQIQRETPPRPGERWGERKGVWEEKAAKTLQHELGVEIQRYGGFDKAWRATQEGADRYGNDAAAASELRHAEARVAYWKAVVEARQVVQESTGRTSYVHDPEPLGKHPRTHLCPTTSVRGTEWISIDTRVMLDGEQVAWFGSDGYVYPLEDLSVFEGRAGAR